MLEIAYQAEVVAGACFSDIGENDPASIGRPRSVLIRDLR